MKFSGGVETFSRRVEKLFRGYGVEIFLRGIENFSQGVGIFREEVEVVPILFQLWLCYFLERGSFSGRLRFFREGFKFFGVVEMLSEVFGIFSGWVGIICVVLSLFRGF